MTENTEIKTKRKLFHKPYKYAEGFVISSLLIITGFIIEFFADGKGVKIPSAPYNIHIGLALITILLFVHIFLREKPFFKFLSSVPVAISAIISLTVIVLLMGLTPQTDIEGTLLTKIGLTHLSKSWVMLMISLFFFTTLGLVTMRRATPLTKRNIGFLLNHFGLWLIIIAAVLGNGDLNRLIMNTYEGEAPVWQASYEDGTYEMPIAIKLINFNVEEYEPKLALINNSSGEIINDDNKSIIQATEGIEFELENWKFKVDTFLKSAWFIDSNWVENNEIGAAQAVKIIATEKNTNNIISGWISCGSYLQMYQILILNQQLSLAMLQPEPEKYSSNIEVFAKDGSHDTVTVEVNKPHKIYGWKIYQISYNQEMGKWSNLSVFELVRDTWLPVVYVGMFMVLAGALYLFWIGKKTKEKNE